MSGSGFIYGRVDSDRVPTLGLSANGAMIHARLSMPYGGPCVWTNLGEVQSPIVFSEALFRRVIVHALRGLDFSVVCHDAR